MSLINFNELIEDYSIITLHGSFELYIQNYISITELVPDRIRIKTGREILTIEGDGLVVEYMDETGIKVLGYIHKLELTRL